MCISQKPGVKREQISKIKFQNRTEMQPKKYILEQIISSSVSNI